MKCPLYCNYRPYPGGVASRLATVIYVAMVMPILYDDSDSWNDSNLKYESYRPYGDFLKIIKLWHLGIEFYGSDKRFPLTIELHSSQTPWIRSIGVQSSTYPMRFHEKMLQTNVVVYMYVWDSQSHTHTDIPWSGYGTVQAPDSTHIYLVRNSCHTQCWTTHKTLLFLLTLLLITSCSHEKRYRGLPKFAVFVCRRAWEVRLCKFSV